MRYIVRDTNKTYSVKNINGKFYFVDKDITELPYWELDYMTSDGNQWIDTEIQYIQGDTIELNGKFTKPQHDDGLIVMKPWNTPTNTRFMFAAATTNGTFCMSYNSLPGAYNFISPTHLDTEFHKWHYEGLTLTIEGAGSLTNSTPYNQGRGTLALFHRFNGACACSIKYYKHWRNGELIADFIPCVRKEDNVVCMYDRVSKQFILNQGTGDFTPGTYKLPSEYTECEYLESNGEQYLDFGVKGNLNTEISLDFMLLKFGASSIINIAGDNTTSASAINFNLGSSGGSPTARFGNKAINAYKGVSNLNTRYYGYTNKTNFVVDDVEIGKFGTTTAFTTTNNLLLFRANGSTYIGSLRVYSAKLYANNVLLKDFVPCLDADGIPCMFDKVSNEAYYNKGSGQFSYAIKGE